MRSCSSPEVELVDVSIEDVQLVAREGRTGVGKAQAPVPSPVEIAERYLAAEARSSTAI